MEENGIVQVDVAAIIQKYLHTSAADDGGSPHGTGAAGYSWSPPSTPTAYAANRRGENGGGPIRRAGSGGAPVSGSAVEDGGSGSALPPAGVAAELAFADGRRGHTRDDSAFSNHGPSHSTFGDAGDRLPGAQHITIT